MKKAALMAGAFLIAGSLAAAPAPNEDGSIRDRIAGFTDAFNAGDAKALSMFWTADGDLVNPTGKYAQGREEISALVGEDMATILKNRRQTFDVTTIRYPAPGVAVVNATHTGLATSPDVQPQSFTAFVTIVMQKARDGKWYFVAARPMVPFSPQPPARPEPVAGKLDGSEWLVGELGGKKSESLFFGSNRFLSSGCVPYGFLSSSYRSEMKGDHVVWSALQVNGKGEKAEWKGESAGPVMTGEYVYTRKNGKSESKAWTAQRVN